MKVLMLTPYLPYPPASGGQVRSYNLIKNLSKKHKITLFSLVKDEKEKAYIKELEKFCVRVRVFKRPSKPWTFKNIFQTVLGVYPFLVVRNLVEEEKKAVINEIDKRKYDLLHAENFYVMPHIPKTKIPVILTEQTILYRVYQHFVETVPWFLFWLKPVLMIDVLKLKYWEIRFWKSADFLAAVSEEDKKQMKKLTGGKKVYLVPNGVDFDYFQKKISEKAKEPTVLFGAADFHWMQNEEGAKILLSSVWPKIKKLVPEAKLWIVGKIAPKVLKDYLNLKDVKIEEIDDSRRAYQKAWVLVAPMRSGGGSRTKLFEAMASGLPVVTTPKGIEGIPIDQKEAIISSDYDFLARKTAEILRSPDLAAKIAKSAKAKVKLKHNWFFSAAELDKLYKFIGGNLK